ncbi:hypothetical protein EVAR_37628_1 [Eumeta japonica]|uniref:Uncharacterized protein n=1 Tax=Eumeta variegata TaxID=151549 RepID=A0A4C1VPD8_EUMVA|nr:hypothetical protein EVAR_37628_1 [Eumeta japonica]
MAARIWRTRGAWRLGAVLFTIFMEVVNGFERGLLIRPLALRSPRRLVKAYAVTEVTTSAATISPPACRIVKKLFYGARWPHRHLLYLPVSLFPDAVKRDSESSLNSLQVRRMGGKGILPLKNITICMGNERKFLRYVVSVFTHLTRTILLLQAEELRVGCTQERLDKLMCGGGAGVREGDKSDTHVCARAYQNCWFAI